MRSALPSPYWSRRCLFSNLQIHMNTYRILSVACSLINHQKLFAISRYFRTFFIYQPKKHTFCPSHLSKSSHWTVTCLAWNGSRHFFPYQKMGFFLRSPKHLRILDTLDIVKLHQGALVDGPTSWGRVPGREKISSYKNQGFSQHHPLNAGWLGMGFLVAWINSKWRKKNTQRLLFVWKCMAGIA